jgi:hypothetical protein
MPFASRVRFGYDPPMRPIGSVGRSVCDASSSALLCCKFDTLYAIRKASVTLRLSSKIIVHTKPVTCKNFASVATDWGRGGWIRNFAPLSLRLLRLCTKLKSVRRV